MSVFRKLEDMMDPANNLSRYRSVLARVSRKDACIPFFGKSTIICPEACSLQHVLVCFSCLSEGLHLFERRSCSRPQQRFDKLFKTQNCCYEGRPYYCCLGYQLDSIVRIRPYLSCPQIEEFRRFQESRYHYPKDEHVYMLCLNLLCLSESE